MGQTTLGDSHLRWKTIYELADLSLAWLSSERHHQRLTDTDADTHSQPWDSGHGSLWRVRGRMEVAVGDVNPLRRQTVSSTPDPWGLRETKPLTEEHTWAGAWPQEYM